MKCIVRPQFYLHKDGKVFGPGELVDWPADEPLPAPLERATQKKSKAKESTLHPIESDEPLEREQPADEQL